MTSQIEISEKTFQNPKGQTRRIIQIANSNSHANFNSKGFRRL